MSSAAPQPPKPQIKTVEIRGLKAEEETDLCIYYFENPQKGGGDVECYEWNDQEKVFFITFSDPEVAKAVSSKGHTVGSKVLEVSLYSPPAEKPEDSQPQCTVEVRGFDPAKTELYEMYFTNPRKGGGTIVQLKLSDNQTVMYMTFETPEVAQRVAEMSHKVGGQRLEVIVAPVEEPTPSCTILVRGYNPGHEELCLYYFENPRIGGGDIIDSVVDEDQKCILMTFENPEVAQDVVARQHIVGGHELDVSLHTPKEASTKRQKSQEPPQEEEQAAAPLRTVVVSAGQRPLEGQDTYILYFESPRCGGGDVERVEFDQEKRLVYITFVDPAVAERVAGKQHRITGHMVEARLYIPPKPRPTYPNKLMFQNVADSTNRNCLSMYLEKISGQEVQEVLYGEEGGTVLVTFPKEPDFQQILQGTQKRSLEQRYLTVSKVPISNCMVVENMNSQTVEDTVRIYFENKRSQGGPVEKVEMVPEENKCFVYFEDHEVLDGVLSRQHRLDGHQLSVKRYLACLGQSGGSVDPTAFTMPKPLHLHNLDPFKVAFLRQTQTTKAAFFQELSSQYAQGRFEDDTLVINCILTPSVPRARILARTWSTDVQQTITSYLGLLEVMKYSVVQQLWTEVEQVMNAASMHSPEAATVFPVPEESTVVIVGMKSMAAELHEKVSTFFKAKEEELERRKQEVTETITSQSSVTETITNQSSDRLSLLLAMGFPLEAGKRHKGLKIDVQKKCIVFHGLLSDVMEAQVEMYQLMETVKTTKISGMTDMQMKLLDSKETKQYIVQKFKSNKIIAVWEFGEQSGISVSAFNNKALVTAVHIIKESVQEHVCQLSRESSQLLQSQKWQTLVSQLKKAQPHGVLLIAPSHDCGQLFITCIDSILHQVVEEVERFIEENTIYSQSVCFSPSRQKLVNMKFKDHLQNIASNLRAHQVQVSMPEPGDKIDIKGTRKGLEAVKKRLELINQVMVCHEQVFEDKNKVKLLTSDCEKDLKMLGHSLQCVLSLRSENDQLQVLGPDPLASAGGKMQTGGSSEMETSFSVQLPNGVTVSVVLGDITRMKVGAIVNAANDRMDHIGGLARDIVKKGGDIIQKECYDKVRQRGRNLKEGDIIVSSPGRLPCQCIIHAVGPVYKDGKSGEGDCLFDTVIACLQTASDNKLPSIAIPAISTGIFSYPAPEATMIILDAVKKFFDVHRRCTVKSVYLCHLSANIVSLFVKALQKMFPSVPSSPTAYRQPAVRKDTYYTQPPMPAAQGRHTDSVHRTINVSVIPGEIAKQSEFQEALSGMGQRSDPGAQSFVASGTQGRQNRRYSEEPVNQPAWPRPVVTGGGLSSNAVEFDIGGLRLVIKKGDITEEDTDAIVNSTNSYLALRWGGVAKALRQKCGPQLERDLRGREHDIQQTGIIMTRAYGLNCKYILHVNADMYSRGWEEGIELCFRTAEMKGIKSVAMPALGTGMGLSPSTLAQALFGTLVEKYKHGKQPGMLEEVRVVLFDTNMIPAFVDTLQQSGSSYNKASSGFFSRLKSAISGSSVMGVKQTVSNPVVQQAPQQVSLFIYAEKMHNVHEVLKAIDEMVKDRFIRREIQDKIITSFDQNDVKRVEQIGEKHKAELQIHRGTGQIIFDGLHKQVFECMQEVSEYIRSVQHEQQEKKMASMLANMVSWCFLEVTTTGTERIEYPPRENQIIETAFQGKEGCAEIKDDGGRVYVIDFNSMMEYPKDDRSSTVSVMRRDKLKDLQEMEQACQNNPLDSGVHQSFQGAPVSGSQGQDSSKVGPDPSGGAPVCSTIQVTGLKPETVHDCIGVFFSNKRRNAGGPVKSVEKAPGSSTAIVHFEHAADAKSVVEKGNHVLEGHQLCVSLYQASDSRERPDQQNAACSPAAHSAVSSSPSFREVPEEAGSGSPHQQPNATRMMNNPQTLPSSLGETGFARSQFSSSAIAQVEGREREPRGPTSYSPDFQHGPSHNQHSNSADMYTVTGPPDGRNAQPQANLPSAEEAYKEGAYREGACREGAHRDPAMGSQRQAGPGNSALIDSYSHQSKQKYVYDERSFLSGGQGNSQRFGNNAGVDQGSHTAPAPGFKPEKKQEIPLPTHWAPMKGEKVKRVELKPDSNEYKRVSEHFGGQTAIKKIERIQNPSLFQQFKVKKKELEQYNPKGTENEKHLFHGTPSESVEAIITNGFNRSYCGKHGTALGNGVYFAANSNVSMGYARGGHMFQARVLVGEYTPGSSGQRMPPPKPNSIRTYDSLSDMPQNATVFVIFHDSQAYPEYLISF